MKRSILAILMAAALMLAGAAQAAGTITLREGRYIIGEDIPAGKYVLTCLSTTGGELGNAYGQIGGVMDSFGGTQGYGSLFGAFGGIMESIVGMTVEVLGGYGEVIKSGTLKTGDRVAITLTTNTALKISDGSCSLERTGY